MIEFCLIPFEFVGVGGCPCGFFFWGYSAFEIGMAGFVGGRQSGVCLGNKTVLKPESPKTQNPGPGDSDGDSRRPRRPRRTTTHTHRTSSIFNSKNLSSFKHRIKLARVPVFLSLPFARGKGSRPLKSNSLSFVVVFGSLVCPKSSKGPYYLTTVTLRQE